MKIGFDACGRAEAAVLCCADEAALCRRCDAAVHSANKLAGRHHRVALLPSTPAPPNAVVDDGHHPLCDICQEKTGYFFCLEDRALLCRPCDVAVHAASVHASAHRRFLITGVRVGDVQSHNHDGAVSPSSSSANSGFPTSSGSDPTSTSDNVRSSLARRTATAAEEERPAEEQWLWSEILADGGGM
ncbi:hypothetical protein QOZ80_5AG0385140 [Eleusine coracana subsp. coracana]|nr:hypothetical protein QOZ80_5AG0385140 [Eleusine coracana subsp. coracana]